MTGEWPVRKAIVLGGYGLIGSACMRALAAEGFAVTGVGRSPRAARAADPDADWRFHDLATLDPAGWRSLLQGADVVVNAAGALQDGARDSLEAIHVTAVARLVEAAAGTPLRIVQISAAGVSPEAPTAFFRTKARGDALLAAGAGPHVILRPTLVLAPDAYGGTALLRGVAALPRVLPRVLPGAQVMTVHLDDLAAAVVRAARGEVPSGTIADITGRGSRSFPDLVDAIRRWQGFAPPRFRPALPRVLLTAAGRGADALGHLGWRSPLRTTALTSLESGVTGDPARWEALTGQVCRDLAGTLADLPATRQERLFARLYFALPLAIATLALFWIVSGLVTLADPARAIAVAEAGALPPPLSAATVYGGALADVALGLAMLWRPLARRAALGMIGLSAAYLAGGLIAAPDLWADPLGPMVKVFPGMTLAAMVALMLEER